MGRALSGSTTPRSKSVCNHLTRRKKAVGAVNYLPLSNSVAYSWHDRNGVPGPKVSGVVLNGSMPGYFRVWAANSLPEEISGFDLSNSPEPPVIVNEAFLHGSQASVRTLSLVGESSHLGHPGHTWWQVLSVLLAQLGPEYEGVLRPTRPVEEEPPSALTFVASVSGESRGTTSRSAGMPSSASGAEKCAHL